MTTPQRLPLPLPHPHRAPRPAAWPRALTAALLIGMAGPSLAALEYQLGGWYRAENGRNETVLDNAPGTGLSATHSGGSTWFAPNGSVLGSSFGASRNGASLTSGVVANEVNPSGPDSYVAKAIGLSWIYGEVLSFEGLSGFSTVTFGYRFQSVVDWGPADVAYELQSTLSARARSFDASGRTGSEAKVNYGYIKTGPMLAPRVTLNDVQGQDPLKSFTHEGTFTVLLSPAYNQIALQMGSRTESFASGQQAAGGTAGASAANGIDLWIEAFSQPSARLAGSLSGHDYAYVAASPVPEPASFWLLGGGALALAAWRRRQRGLNAA